MVRNMNLSILALTIPGTLILKILKTIYLSEAKRKNHQVVSQFVLFGLADYFMPDILENKSCSDNLFAVETYM